MSNQPAANRPALTRAGPEDVVARSATGPVTGHGFALAAAGIAARLDGHAPVINLCERRYSFAVVLAGCLVAGATMLLPAARTQAAARAVLKEHPGAVIIGDVPDAVVSLTAESAMAGAAEPAQLNADAAQVLATLHTSGSTGVPTAHAKAWGELVGGIERVAARLGVEQGTTFVATVPPQHMFGLEASVLLPLRHGGILTDARPMFPEDLRAELETASNPRALVTTPVHLRVCLDSNIAFPPVSWVLSATAPLDAGLAQEAERRLQAPLHEIYGSTETGAVAMRRTARETLWTPLPGVRLRAEGEHTWVEAEHLPGRVALNDTVEHQGGERFWLLGRRADMLNLAGKRASLGELNLRLTAVEGVDDGVFYVPPDADAGHVQRLAAFVVAPQRSEQDILAALRAELDPAFVPRPLVRVNSLPRNEAGKIPRRELDELARRHLRRR